MVESPKWMYIKCTANMHNQDGLPGNYMNVCVWYYYYPTDDKVIKVDF